MSALSELLTKLVAYSEKPLLQAKDIFNSPYHGDDKLYAQTVDALNIINEAKKFLSPEDDNKNKIYKKWDQLPLIK